MFRKIDPLYASARSLSFIIYVEKSDTNLLRTREIFVA